MKAAIITGTIEDEGGKKNSIIAKKIEIKRRISLSNDQKPCIKSDS